MIKSQVKRVVVKAYNSRPRAQIQGRISALSLRATRVVRRRSYSTQGQEDKQRQAQSNPSAKDKDQSHAKQQHKQRKTRSFRSRPFLLLALVPIGLYLARPREQAQAWHVAAYSALPLKALSRAWGQFNDIELPVWMRTPGYKLYSNIFGADLDEILEKDLTKYRNLGDFFYRELEPGARPVSESLLVMPSDGKVLALGQLVDNQIEQVKGVTYTIDAFLGVPGEVPHHTKQIEDYDGRTYDRDEDFASLNGLSYTLDDLVGSHTGSDKGDENMKEQAQHHTQSVGDMADTSHKNTRPVGLADAVQDPQSWIPDIKTLGSNKSLYFAVVYLAPGDYHRFHSPANWVVQLRRHFIGELFSVAPYFQSKFADLFCLNERVALLGKWRYGFFSMTPVGATNVGSILLNFDKQLRTNTKWITEGDSREKTRRAQCYEATYSSASPLLRGYPLQKGSEMGGFRLGSTVVLVFEAPETFKFDVAVGAKVKMGQSLGNVGNNR